MTLRAGELDRRILIRRAAAGDDGLSATSTASTDPAPQPGDLKRWAKRTDISDAERFRAAQQGIEVTSRFLVRYDTAVAGLGSTDVIISDGELFAVAGAKEARGRRVAIEITATARPFPPDQSA